VIRVSNPGWEWQPETIGFSPRMAVLLHTWRDTKYMSGQQCPGVFADCLGFVFGMVDGLLRQLSPGRKVLPPDTSMHSRSKAIACMRTLFELYPGWEKVKDGTLQPGDVIVTGHTHGGPGHVMIVGPVRNTLWHCNEGVGVASTGIGFADGAQSIFGVYRFNDRESWL